ncbi:MAG: hypothetical protein FJX46_03965 [Alphaproteobacteria bacterium]|nr:hypothetical protein [Alphaproteobacteria bacterium]
MSEYRTIRLAFDEDGLATITLARPETHNAISDIFIEEMSEALEDVANADGAYALVLEAEGKSFCAGADLEWMKRAASYDRERNLEDARALGEMLRRLNFLTLPTIALVQGPSYGGGVGVVACCDIVIAARDAAFTLTEVRLGLLPATISPYVVAAIGQRAARRYFMTAERFDAVEAQRLGLVTEVVEAASDLRPARDRALARFATNAPGAIADSKQLVFDVDRPVDAELIEMTARRIADRRQTEEGREGIASFLERRKPRWVR